MAKQYFNGQGKIYLGQRDSSGNPLVMKYVGNAPDFKFALEEEIFEHKESYSGNRLTDVRLTTELKASTSMLLEQLDADNLNFLLYGTTAAQAVSAVTNEAIQGSTSVAVGDIYLLDSMNIAALAIKDSTGSPKTLTLNTNYTADLKTGQIEIIELTTGGPFTGPLTADYTRASATNITKLFGQSAVEYWVRFAGKNTAVSGSPEVIVDLYRVRLSPAAEMALINDEIAQFQLEGSVLADDTKTQAGVFGQFGRIVML